MLGNIQPARVGEVIQIVVSEEAPIGGPVHPEEEKNHCEGEGHQEESRPVGQEIHDISHRAS